MRTTIFKLFFLGILLNSKAFAGPAITGGGTGDTATYISCENENFSFLIRGTAVPSFKQGLLQYEGDENPIKLSCKPDDSLVAKNQPSAGQVLWSCREYPINDGNILIKVEISGLTGLKSASISRMQTFPLDPQQIATMNCSQ